MAQPGPLKRSLRTVAKTAFAVADFPYRVRPGPRILIYHQVGSGLGRQMEVTEDSFAFQVQWLLRAGSIVSLDEAIERRGESGASNLFVLTFDDGYLDIYEKALPILKSGGIPFTVYVTTQPIEEGKALTPGGRAEPLTWDQLAEMQASGATIGSHTHTHPDLRSLDRSGIEREMELSDKLIQHRLGTTPVHFCYPYGFWSPDADRHARARYKTATLGAGPPFTGGTDLLKIPRVPVQLGDGKGFFVRKMKSGLVNEERVRRRLNGYRGEPVG